ncbi:MAG TPA: tripartite tricarboxylate transporter substrate binding protein [Burkholderiales bacterium]|nr:tripartite tricarboxylate transporter substrate binding protein [Burkholderiales bacterium]
MCSGGVLAAMLCAFGAGAQPYPAKPVRVIVGFPPASGADITARVIGPKLADALGQSVIVDNRPGAASNIAAELAAKSAPDGYTLFIGTVANAINATLYPRLPFDFARDFAPVALATAAPNILVVHPSVPAKTVRELIALAKRRPGELNFASAGTGTAPHMSGELFKAMAGVSLVHIPYKGSPPAVADVLAGEVAMIFSPASTVLHHVKSGRLRALAVTTASRLASLPDLPTVAESGLAGYETVTWFGYVAPAKTAREIVARLNAEIVRALALPQVRDQFAAQGIEVLGGTPEQFGAYIREEIAKWAKVIKLSGARAE